MKKNLILAIVMFLAFAAKAQQYKSFRVLLSGGIASGSGAKSVGLFGSLEPGYRVLKNVNVGLKGEIAGIARGDYKDLKVDVDVSRINSLTLNAVYYFDDDFIRPFAGIGFGNYWLSSIEYRVDTSGPARGTGKETKAGFYPRAGVEVGHLHFSVDYNFIAKTSIPGEATFKNSHLAIRFGVFFGGGRVPDK